MPSKKLQESLPYFWPWKENFHPLAIESTADCGYSIGDFSQVEGIHNYSDFMSVYF